MVFECVVQIDQMQLLCVGVLKCFGLCCGIGVENGCGFYVVVQQMYVIVVFEVDGGVKDYCIFFVVGVFLLYGGID